MHPPLWRHFLVHEHEIYMKIALSLAEKGMGWTEPNPMVGAVIVKKGRIISYGYHEKFGSPHAEAIAIEKAGKDAKGATLYVNLEPCCHFGKTPPCCLKIWEAGIKRVVASIGDPNPLVNGKGFSFLREKGIEVITGVLKEEAEDLNRHFLWFYKKRLPWITGKMAMTLDGATVWGERWISSEGARHFAHFLRATHMGIMVGINTVLEDNPLLNVRHPYFRNKKLVKVVLDSKLKININANIFRTGDKVIIFTASNKSIPLNNVHIIKVDKDEKGLNLHRILEKLYDLGIMSVLVEGGRTLLGNMLNKGMVNELYIVNSPKIGGSHKLDVLPLNPVRIWTFYKDGELYTRFLLKR